MDDQQNAAYVTDGMEPLFALNHAVFADNYVRIAEDSSRLSKPTACFAMFARSLAPSHSNRTVILLHCSIYNVAAASCATAGVAQACELCKIGFMERDHVIAALKAHERELRMAGVESVSLFGSVARGEGAPGDVDLAVRLGEGVSAPGLDYFSRLGELEGRQSGILGWEVDVIEEPVRKKRFQTEIDRDRAMAF